MRRQPKPFRSVSLFLVHLLCAVFTCLPQAVARPGDLVVRRPGGRNVTVSGGAPAREAGDERKLRAREPGGARRPESADLVWQEVVKGRVAPRLVVTPRFVLLSKDSRQVECRWSWSGRLAWKWRSPADIAWPAALGEYADVPPAMTWDRIFLSGADGVLRALDLDTGRRVWKYDTGAGPVSLPVIASGRVFVVDGRNRIHAVRCRDGGRIWIASPRRPLSAPLWAGPSMLLAGFAPDRLYALDPERGKPFWKTGLQGGMPRLWPVVFPGRLALTTDRGRLYVLGRAGGAVKSSIEIGSEALPGMRLRGTTLLLAARAGRCLAVDVLDGRLRWSLDIGPAHWRTYGLPGYMGTIGRSLARLSEGRRRSALSFFGSDGRWAVVVTAGGSRLCCVDTVAGRVRWTRPLRRDPMVPPMVKDGAVYCCGFPLSTAALVRHRAGDGLVEWRTASRVRPVTMPVVTPDGLVVFADAAGRLLAWR